MCGCRDCIQRNTTFFLNSCSRASWCRPRTGPTDSPHFPATATATLALCCSKARPCPRLFADWWTATMKTPSESAESAGDSRNSRQQPIRVIAPLVLYRTHMVTATNQRSGCTAAACEWSRSASPSLSSPVTQPPPPPTTISITAVAASSSSSLSAPRAPTAEV